MLIHGQRLGFKRYLGSQDFALQVFFVCKLKKLSNNNHWQKALCRFAGFFVCKLKKLSNKKVGKEPPVAQDTAETPAAEAEMVVSKQPLTNGHAQPLKKGAKKQKLEPPSTGMPLQLAT